MSGSISTSAICVPFGYVGGSTLNSSAARSLSAVLSGCAARSANVIIRSVPATRTVPSAISRSPAAASRASAAMSLIWLASFLLARSTETPPTGIELDPPVPAPLLIRSVSPWMTRTRSGGRSRRSEMSCAYAVACPCPVDCDPISKVTPPSRSSVRAAVSGPLLPHASM